MTIESPMAIIRQNGGSVYDGVYKDNCAPNMLQCAADHSLQMDLNISVYSPNSQHMYESDIAGANIKDPLLSPTSSSVCSVSSPLDSFDFDLKPQFEQSKDIFPCVSRASELDWGYPNPMCGGDPHMGSSILGLNMEDIIQVEEMDLNHGPTLAQLNSADSVSPFDDGIDLDEVSEICKTATRIMPMPTMAATSVSNTCFSPLTKCNTNCTATVSSPMDTTLPASCNSSILASNCLQQTPAPVIPEQTAMAIPASQPPAVGSSCLQELLMKKEMPDQQQLQPAHNVQSPVMEMLPPAPTIKVASLKRPVSPSSDTSTSTGSIDKKWEDIKHFLHEEQEQAMSPLAAQRPILKKFKTEPQDIAFNPQDEVMSSAKEEVYDSDADDGSGSENEDMIDADSDAESEGSQSSFMDEYVGGGKKDRRYFWQYNTQAKGPKGKRLCKQVEADDPHILNDFEDPVFDPDQNQMRYKHNGKARRGDGNDIGPNPSKLFSLGNELKKLNRRINEMLPVNELPNPARSKTRKEKNKFASRACRLKKKAQHEANKLKLFGLEQEHRQLMSVLGDIKGYIRKNLDSPKAMQGNVSPKLELLIRTNLTEMIAGNTTEYVNTVLDRVAKGEKNGGVVLD